MLSLLFKEKISEEQDTYLFNKFKDCPIKYEHDLSEIDMKMSIYIGNSQRAQEISDDLKLQGFKFISQISNGKPLFHDSFVCNSSENLTENPAENPAENQEIPSEDVSIHQPNDSESHHENLQKTPSQEPSSSSSTAAHWTPNSRGIEMKPTRCVLNDFNTNHQPFEQLAEQYVTRDQFEELKKKSEQQMNAFAINLKSQVEALTASVAMTSAMRHDHANYSMPPHAHHQVHPASGNSSKRTPQLTEYKAKNELIANGIRCEKCNKTIKGLEPISKLIMAVRDHVLTHFDSENPLLKRFECREHSEFRTNFVDEFEKHLHKHNAFNSLPERRQMLCVNLTTESMLKSISDLCNVCFPEVFEKTPPAINTIIAVDTPLKAKVSIFPRLDRLYCTRFNIPYSCNGRVSAPLVKLD